jgi:hypothetical protein
MAEQVWLMMTMLAVVNGFDQVNVVVQEDHGFVSL